MLTVRYYSPLCWGSWGRKNWLSGTHNYLLTVCYLLSFPSPTSAPYSLFQSCLMVNQWMKERTRQWLNQHWNPCGYVFAFLIKLEGRLNSWLNKMWWLYAFIHNLLWNVQWHLTGFIMKKISHWIKWLLFQTSEHNISELNL